MDRVAPSGGEATALRRFKRLVNYTIFATFVLVLIGGIVRVSDSGLGCGPAGSGTHGWPLCEGGLLPVASAESVIEYSHRITAGIVGVLIALIALRAYRELRGHRWILRAAVAAGVLVLIQAGLGGLTVEEGLDEYLVAAHLGLAMLLLGLLLALRRFASEPGPPPAAPAPDGRLRSLSILVSALILATIVAGGLVAGTEKEGTPGAAQVFGAHTACGEQFPTCVDRFMPFGEDRLIDIQLTHRAFMYLTVLAVIALVIVAVRRRASRAYVALGGLVAAQVLLGAANVWLGKHAGLIVGHLMLGTMVWACSAYATFTLIPTSSPVSSRAHRPDRTTEAATA